MKHIHEQFTWLLTPFVLGVLSMTSCKDFDDVNRNPYEAGADQVQMEYFINNAIISAQMDPHIAERQFILHWKDAGHMEIQGTLSEMQSNDGWNSDYFNYVTTWLSNINAAISLYQQRMEAGTAFSYSNNLYQVARIWRAYLMSEFTDNFGAMPVDGFQDKPVTFNTVEEVYAYLLKELKEAANGFDAETVNDNVKKLDPAYGYDFAKWQKYANSMRMRLAMRLSEVKPELAQKEFEDAAKSGKYIAEVSDNFGVQERSGWDPLAGVMSREWNYQILSPTLNNLYIGLGGITSEKQIGTYAKEAVQAINKERAKAENGKDSWHMKPITLKFNEADWMGVKWEDHFTTMTNDPSSGYWNDGLCHAIDPRAYKIFSIPGDINNPTFCKYPSWASANATNTDRALYKPESAKAEKPDTLTVINSSFAWNAVVGGDWGEKGSINKVFGFPGNLPRLIINFRNSTMKRIFFGSWETYFLLSEASVRGWQVPTSGKDAYERGIRESFAYYDAALPNAAISTYLDAYLSSTDYNRVGTSVKWDHTAEPPATKAIRYRNGKTQAIENGTYKYPVNHLYKNGKVKNDQLTKIITQKFIAQTPWLPLETWSDHRRLGLPFFENPAVEKTIEGFEALTKSNYMESRWEFFPQRQMYPSSLKNNAPEAYAEALKKLGGEDKIGTKMWWSGRK